MTIDEAIEILEARQRNTPSMGYEDLRDANQLGIEALIVIRRLQSMDAEYKDCKLPGETPETTSP